MSSLNGVHKRRLTAKETAIASWCTRRSNASLFQGFFGGVIIKASVARPKVTELLFAFALNKLEKLLSSRSLVACFLFVNFDY